jgi:hypothetical protein
MDVLPHACQDQMETHRLKSVLLKTMTNQVNNLSDIGRVAQAGGPGFE